MDVSDNTLTRELSSAVHELRVQIAEIRTLFTEWSPVLKGQVYGLAQLENRVTRTEDKVSVLQKNSTDECGGLTTRLDKEIASLQEKMKGEKETADKRVDGNFRLFGVILTLMGLLLAALAFAAHVKYTP